MTKIMQEQINDPENSQTIFTKKKVGILILFSVVFSLSFYFSVVGMSGLIRDPATALKLGVKTTMEEGPVTIRFRDSVADLGIAPFESTELMSMVLNDMILDASFTYFENNELWDYQLNLSSTTYGDEIISLQGVMEDDVIYFTENKLLNGTYYIEVADENPYDGDWINNFIDVMLSDVSKAGVVEYKTIDDRTAYANQYTAKGLFDGNEVLLDVLIDNRMNIIGTGVEVGNDNQKVIETMLAVENSHRVPYEIDKNNAVEFSAEELMEAFYNLNGE